MAASRRSETLWHRREFSCSRSFSTCMQAWWSEGDAWSTEGRVMHADQTHAQSPAELFLELQDFILELHDVCSLAHGKQRVRDS